MSTRRHHVKVTLSDRELSRLDELRDAAPRAVYLRRLLYDPPRASEVATRNEALSLLSEQARAGKVAATIALERALRDEDEESMDDAIDRILG